MFQFQDFFIYVLRNAFYFALNLPDGPLPGLCAGLRQAADHLLGSRPRRRAHLQRADHAQRRPHTLGGADPGELGAHWLIFCPW